MDSAADAEKHSPATCIYSVTRPAGRGKLAPSIIEYLRRNPPPVRHRQSELANRKCCGLRDPPSSSTAMTNIDAIWLATEPMDVCAGTETMPGKVIAVFDAAQPHCAYLFANCRANRMKVLVHDGFGIGMAARRLNQRKFHWPGICHGSEMELDTEHTWRIFMPFVPPTTL